MQISPADRSIAVAIAVKADGAGAPASAAATAAAKTAAEPLRAGVTQPGKGGGDYLGAPQGAKGPDTPSSTSENRDWAVTVKSEVEKKKEEEKEPIKPPLSELLLQQFTSLWRASAQAVDPGIQAQAMTQANRQAQIDATGKSAPLVYTDPSKVRKTPSAEGA